MEQDKQVSFCIIESPETREILFLERVKKPHEWSLPGGKFDDSETPYRAMTREVFEETGLMILPNTAQYLGVVRLKDDKVGHVFHIWAKEFKPVLAEGEHKKFVWVKDWKKLKLAGKVKKMLKLMK